MTVLVTGATGFIGRHLTAALTAKQQPVLALMRRPGELAALQEQVTRLGGHGNLIRALPGDLSAPGLGLQDPLPALAGIIHLGASFAWELDWRSARATNVDGSVAVAELAAARRCRLVFVSGFTLENDELMRAFGVDVDMPSRTHWPDVYRRAGGYEASKLEAAFAVRALAESTTLELVEVQPAAVAGHSQTGVIDPAQPLYQLIDSVARGRLSMLPGTPDHWLPLVPVDRLADMIAEAAMATTPPARLLALDADTPAFPEMISRIARTLGKKAPRRHIPVGLLKMLLMLPGLAKRMNTYPEALHFIQTHRYDTRASDEFFTSRGLLRSDIGSVIERTAQHYANAGVV